MMICLFFFSVFLIEILFNWNTPDCLFTLSLCLHTCKNNHKQGEMFVENGLYRINCSSKQSPMRKDWIKVSKTYINVLCSLDWVKKKYFNGFNSLDDFLHPALKYPFPKSNTLGLVEENSCTFRILASKWNIFSTLVHTDVEVLTSVISTCTAGCKEHAWLWSRWMKKAGHYALQINCLWNVNHCFIIMLEHALQKLKGYSNPAGGHLAFISQWNLTNCRYIGMHIMYTYWGMHYYVYIML